MFCVLGACPFLKLLTEALYGMGQRSAVWLEERVQMVWCTGEAAGQQRR